MSDSSGDTRANDQLTGASPASGDGRHVEATSVATPERERAVVAALRAGDEQAFTLLVDEYTPSLLRLAMLYVSSRALAEDVVQETWLGVLRGLDRFEGRSVLKTWIFRILVNIAKTRAQREGRTIPFSALAALDAERDGPALDVEPFVTPDGQPGRGHWASLPANWDVVPEERLLSLETREQIQRAIAALPPAQREVITLRDVEGWASDEVCNLLGISETNQRVLLHRARSRVRQALAAYLGQK